MAVLGGVAWWAVGALRGGVAVVNPVTAAWVVPCAALLWGVNLALSAWLVHRQTLMAAVSGEPVPSRVESLALTVAAGLLNYLPVPKAGWVGRAAYLMKNMSPEGQ